jgi:CBS-domain-containing membrane protein
MKRPTHPRVAERTVKVLCPEAPQVAIVADATIFEAAKLMAAHDLGALPVTDGGRIVGVFSERDFARTGLRDGGTPTTVRQAMTECLLFATPAQTLQECLDLMTEKRLRHLPVIDGDALAGMVDIEDLLREIVSHHARVFHELEMDWSILFLRGTYSC